jgi:hypothetical protein
MEVARSITINFGEMKMERARFSPAIFTAAYVLSLTFTGCYASSAGKHGEDASQDGVEVVPSHSYVLHEWGVITKDVNGTQVYGPPPALEDYIGRKPVIYLYPDGEVAPLDISVKFSSGEATDAWPPVALGPQVEWADLVLRPGSCDWTPFPPLELGVMCESCNLASSIVEEAGCIVREPEEGPAYTSKLLFYAGDIREYRPPLEAQAEFPDCDGGPCVRFSGRNSADYAVDHVWFVYRKTADMCATNVDPYYCVVASADIAWRSYSSLDPGATFEELLAIGHYEAPIDEYGFPIGDPPLPREWLGMGEELHEALVGRGLTEAEADAFIENWAVVFFGLMAGDSYEMEPLYSNGAFIIYFMDERGYSSLFQLTANPPPADSVRVGLFYEKLY